MISYIKELPFLFSLMAISVVSCLFLSELYLFCRLIVLIVIEVNKMVILNVNTKIDNKKWNKSCSPVA